MKRQKYIIIWDLKKKKKTTKKTNRNKWGLWQQNNSEKAWFHAIKSLSSVPYFSSSEINSGAGPSSISPFMVCLLSWPLPSPAIYKRNYTPWFQYITSYVFYKQSNHRWGMQKQKKTMFSVYCYSLHKILQNLEIPNNYSQTLLPQTRSDYLKTSEISEYSRYRW